MIDPLVLLAPVLVFAVVLLLGFAGCHDVFGLDPVSLPSYLCLKVRVPATLTVTAVKYGWRPPGGEEVTFPTNPVPPVPDSTEDGDSIFSHCISNPPEGPWTVACWVTVTRNGTSLERGAQGGFTLDGTKDTPTASFQASESPSGVFFVGYVGLS